MGLFDSVKLPTLFTSLGFGFLVFLVILVVFYAFGAGAVGVVVALVLGLGAGYATYTTDWIVRGFIYLYSGKIGLTAYDAINSPSQTIGQTLVGAEELLI